jgi:hypothetical protein
MAATRGHIFPTAGAGIRGENWQALAGVEKVLPMKYWEITADKLSAAGWSWGMTTANDPQARELFIVDAQRDDGRRFIARSDELLAGSLELEQAARNGLPPGCRAH